MKTDNLQPDGSRAGQVTRGLRKPKRSAGEVLVRGEDGTEVLANEIFFASLTVTDDDDGTAIISGGGSGASGGEVWAQADGGLVGDGLSDDTTALQNLIDDCTLDGTQSCTINFEPGTYLIGGALRDTGDFNAQILLPPGATAKITLTLQGPIRPTQGMGLTAPGVAILKSTLTGATGTAAVFSAGNTSTADLQVVIRNLLCIAPDNPTMTFWNLLQTLDGQRDGLLIRAGVAAGFATQPTNTNAYGIKLPQTSQGSYHREHILVQGFYWGVRHSELTWGDYIIWNCYKAVEVVFSYHIGGGFQLQTLSCAYGIVVTGQNQLDIIYDAEHRSAEGFAITPGNYPSWGTNVADLYDPSNLLTGHIRWWGVKAAVGIDHEFIVSGGVNVFYEEHGTGPALPGGGTPLLADDHSNPPVFADIIWSEDGEHMLFSDTMT